MTRSLRGPLGLALTMAAIGGCAPASGGPLDESSGGQFGSGSAPGVGGILGSGGNPSLSGGSGGQVLGGGGGPTHLTCPGEAANAYHGTPKTAPGTIPAEDFDITGFSDSTSENEGGAYRTTAVDIKEQAGEFVVGWMMVGEWLEYTVSVPAAGDYALTISAGAVDAGRTLEFSQCGSALADPIAVPVVSDWGQIATTSPATVHLAAGVQVIRVSVAANDYVDFDSFTLEAGDAGSGGTGGGGSGSGGSGSGGSPGELPKFIGNISTFNSVDTDGLIYSDYWDQLTPENAGKWGSVQSSAGSARNWATLDAFYDYAEQKGIVFKQHTFLWGPQQPSGNITEEEVKSWMTEFCERYPNTRLIDVVNEPPPHTEPSYSDAIGGGTNGSWQWITNAFTWAREACPNAVLILNDYNNIEWSDQTNHFIDITNTVLDAGGPIDAVGAQAHGLSGSQVSDATMISLITRLHEDTGLPVYVTEYDIDDNNDASQLAEYQSHMRFFLDTEWIHGITVWGWIHGKTWVDNSGLIRDGSPRSAMTWLMNELGRPVPP